MLLCTTFLLSCQNIKLHARSVGCVNRKLNVQLTTSDERGATLSRKNAIIEPHNGPHLMSELAQNASIWYMVIAISAKQFEVQNMQEMGRSSKFRITTALY